MKGFVKLLVWIVVLAGVLAGVYYVLPEYPQSFVKSIVQPMTDSAAKAKIEQVQGITNKDLDGLTYKTLLEANTKNPCWVYKLDEATGVEYVTFYGRGASLNLKDYTEYQGKLYTSASVKMEFVITNGTQVQIHTYIDGVSMEINDGNHEEENKQIRLDILSQLYSGTGLVQE